MQVAKYIEAKKELLDMFGVDDDYFIKPCIDKKWELDIEGELPLLKFGNNESCRQICVIVKKDNRLMIQKRRKYTLVVALDCVKICFIFENTMQNSISLKI